MFKKIFVGCLMGIFLFGAGFEGVTRAQMGHMRMEKAPEARHEMMGPGMMIQRCGGMMSRMSKMMHKGKCSPEKMRKMAQMMRKMADHMEKMAEMMEKGQMDPKKMREMNQKLEKLEKELEIIADYDDHE